MQLAIDRLKILYPACLTMGEHLYAKVRCVIF